LLELGTGAGISSKGSNFQNAVGNNRGASTKWKEASKQGIPRETLTDLWTGIPASYKKGVLGTEKGDGTGLALGSQVGEHSFKADWETERRAKRGGPAPIAGVMRINPEATPHRGELAGDRTTQRTNDSLGRWGLIDLRLAQRRPCIAGLTTQKKQQGNLQSKDNI